jgi:hypothetical protein
MSLTIIPKDVKLLLSKCYRSEPIIATSNKILELKQDAHICYDIIIKNVNKFNVLELCLGDIVLYKKSITKDIINIDLFTKQYPLLLTHIDKQKINIKLYNTPVETPVETPAETPADHINIEYKYEQIDTHKYNKIWHNIPATQFVDGQFLIYINNTIIFMGINELYRHKNILSHTIRLYKDEWLVNVYVEDCIPPALTDPIVKNLYHKIDYSNRYLGYIQFHIKGEYNLSKFLELSKVLWKEYTSIKYQIEYEKDSQEYIYMINLIAELNN